MEHVQRMDCRTAYENMCRANDEIERLKKEIDEMEGGNDENEDGNVSKSDGGDLKVINESLTDTIATVATNDEKSQDYDHTEESSNAMNNLPTGINNENRSQSELHPKEPAKPNKVTNIKKASGTWLDEGGKCSIEYLPNIKCYHITLTSNNPIELNRDDLQFTMSPYKSLQQNQSSEFVFYDMQLVHSSSSNTLLSVILPANSPTNHQDRPTATISTDSHSISLRIYMQMMDSTSIDLMDNLVYMRDAFIFSTNTTPATQMNHLYCRNCHSSPIIMTNDNNTSENNPTIKSVLPLPAGYWDDIEDYLICYEGQPSINFSTSTIESIPHIALEDDAVIVLHGQDVNVNTAVCTTRYGKGYGEHTALRGGGGEENVSSSQQLWKDKSAMKGGRGNTITCRKCWATLGFVSGHDTETLRFYKHLLHCGQPTCSLRKEEKNVFSKYTCGSFLAREMVRYAESEAIYTFIVGVSDENDWTRLSKSSECILLHMLSWDSALVGVGGEARNCGDGGDEAVRFEKVLKVIYDETIDRGQHDTSTEEDDPSRTQWTWGGIDLCCPPPSAMDNGEEERFAYSTEPQVKATAVRIFLSTQEWSELKHTLASCSVYFSEAMKDAIVMSKLGLPLNGSRHSASLSYLPLLS